MGDLDWVRAIIEEHKDDLTLPEDYTVEEYLQFCINLSRYLDDWAIQ